MPTLTPYPNADPLEQEGYKQELAAQLESGKKTLLGLQSGLASGVLKPKSELSMASVSRGEDLLTKTKATEQRLATPAPTVTTDTSAPAPAPKPTNKGTEADYVTLINAETGQTQKYYNPQQSKQTIDSLLKSNWAISESQISDGTAFGVGTPTTQTADPFDVQFEKDKAQYETDVAKLRNFETEMANDPALANLLTSIGQQWDARIKETERMNTSRKAAIETAGVRFGSRYAGGSAGPMAGIVSAEERAGLDRIDQLIGMKNTALADARSAYESKKWTQYAKNVEIAEKAMAESKSAIAELNKANIAENAKRQEAAQKAEREATRDSAVAGLIMDGISDPKEILNFLNFNEQGEMVGDFTAEEIAKTVKNLSGDEKKTPEDLGQDIQDYNYLSALPDRGGIPESIQNPIQYMQYKSQLDKAVKDKSTQPDPVTNISPVDSPRGTPSEGSITSLDDIDSLPVSDITKAVMSGLIGMKELTPTAKSEVAAELYKVGFNPKSYINNKLEGLVALYSAIPDNQRGLVEGFVKPWATHTIPEVGRFESAKDVLTREVARLNDVGVLSDQDVATYKNAMPSRMDKDVNQVIAKLSGIGLATGGSVSQNVGKTGTLNDGRKFIVGPDGETLFDPATGQELK